MNRLLFCLFLSVGLCLSGNCIGQDSLHLILLSDSIPVIKSKAGKAADFNFQQQLVLIPVDSAIAIAPLDQKKPIASKPLSFRSIAIPTALIGYGAFTFANKDLQGLNLQIRRVMWEDNGQRHFGIDDFTLAAPVVAVYALNLAGVKGKNNFIDRTALYGMSYLIGSSVVSTVKRMTGVVRPDSSNFYSFPSGHTSQAFIAAEFMRQEYKDRSPWYGIAAYAVAAGTGYLRMYNNKHWFNDVMAGAGVGILSTRVSYWLYPKIKNLFVKDKNKELNTVVMPMYQNGAVGFGLVHRFK